MGAAIERRRARLCATSMVLALPFTLLTPSCASAPGGSSGSNVPAAQSAADPSSKNAAPSSAGVATASPPDARASSSTSPPPHGGTASAASSAEDEELDRVAAIHGAPGPWAVAGYRMGKYALAKLGLGAGTFDLEITHHTPKQVMFSCIADGAAAATGASVGKLNLWLVDSRAEDVATTYRKRSSGEAVTLRPAARFRARFADTPREHARDFGREVLRLPDSDVFEEVATSAPRPAPVSSAARPESSPSGAKGK
jgi:formylmethanofuran dehydrogenase subunit E